jgi:hypothetical protein
MARIPTVFRTRTLARDSLLSTPFCQRSESPQTLLRTSPARQFYTHPELERPNGYHCPYPCRISTDGIDLPRCTVCRFVVLTGPVRALQVHRDAVVPRLPRRLTSARSSLLHGSDNRIQSEALRSINADDGGTLFSVPSQGAFHQKNKDAWKHQIVHHDHLWWC